jgi:hypothetical protein
MDWTPIAGEGCSAIPVFDRRKVEKGETSGAATKQNEQKTCEEGSKGSTEGRQEG